MVAPLSPLPMAPLEETALETCLPHEQLGKFSVRDCRNSLASREGPGGFRMKSLCLALGDWAALLWAPP